MKLRDKETGKVRTFDFVVISDDYRKDGELTKFSSPFHILVCRSIEQLNEEWENYEPAEPLIKDEKIRKAVRAWAEANGEDEETRLEYCYDDNRLRTGTDYIEFNQFTPFRKLKDGATYTIDELCGEEEAPEPLEPTFIDLDERIREKEEE